MRYTRELIPRITFEPLEVRLRTVGRAEGADNVNITPKSSLVQLPGDDDGTRSIPPKVATSRSMVVQDPHSSHVIRQVIDSTGRLLSRSA